MTLQELLLKLSNNKNIRVDCFCCESVCTVVLSDWYTNEWIKQVKINLTEIIDETPFKDFI